MDFRVIFCSGTTSYFFFEDFFNFFIFFRFSCITFWKIVARATTRDCVQGQKRGEKEVPKVIVYIGYSTIQNRDEK